MNNRLEISLAAFFFFLNCALTSAPETLRHEKVTT